MYYTTGHHITEDILILEWPSYLRHVSRMAAYHINLLKPTGYFTYQHV